MTRYKTFVRDELVINVLKQHKGVHNSISASELAKQTGVKRDYVHTLVRKIMYKYHLPIGSINSNGYYWIISKKDIENSIEHLEARKNALDERINHLKSFLM